LAKKADPICKRKKQLEKEAFDIVNNSHSQANYSQSHEVVVENFLFPNKDKGTANLDIF